MDSPSVRPLITTIIPTYRRPKYLRRSIRSVLNQTYPNFQLCIYDNASGDSTREVVAQIAKNDPRVKYHCHSKNLGPIENMNYGLKQVTTPYFSLLADDNILLPTFFEDALDALNSTPEAIFFAGQTIMVNEKRERIKGSLDRWNSGLIVPPKGLINMIENGIPNWESILFRTKVINGVGLLDTAFGGAVDQDFMMRIGRRHIFKVSKKKHALFFVHGNSWSSSRGVNERIVTFRKVLKPWLADEELPESMKRRITKRWKHFISQMIPIYIYEKAIVAQNEDAIHNITQLMKKEGVYSLRAVRAVVAARFSIHNRFLRRMILRSFHYYMIRKMNYISRRNERIYGSPFDHSVKYSLE